MNGVSCLCVTKNLRLLPRAVKCFQDQDHDNRELVIVTEADEIKSYVVALGDTKIKCVPVTGRLSLGRLRNLSVASASKEYVTQWDDDDWYSPNRLSAQLEVVKKSARPGCILVRWTIYNALRQTAYVSCYRPFWEGSVFVRKDCMDSYPDREAGGEDTPTIQAMFWANKLTQLDRPELYVYVYHGGNTWPEYHFDRFCKTGHKLDTEQTRNYQRLLALMP